MLNRAPLALLGLVLLLSACDPSDGPSDKIPEVPADSLSLLLQDLERRIVEDPSNAALYARRSAIHVRYDSTEAAVNDLLRAIALDSTNAEYQLRLGEVHYLKLRVDEAVQRFEKALALDPRNTEALLKLAEVQMVLRHYQRAMDLTNDALRIDPYVAHGYYLKGWIHKESGDTAKAISSFHTAVEQDPQEYNAYIQLGLLYATRKDPLALEFYASALELRPRSVEALYNMGMFCQENGRDSMALEAYDRIKTIDPRNALAWYNSGWVRMEHLDDPEQAEQDLTTAIELLPTMGTAYYNRGLVRERQGRLEAAVQDYTQALRISPTMDLAAEALDRLASRGVRVDRP